MSTFEKFLVLAGCALGVLLILVGVARLTRKAESDPVIQDEERGP